MTNLIIMTLFDYILLRERRIGLGPDLPLEKIMNYQPNIYTGDIVRANAHDVKQDTKDPILRNISMTSIANYICKNGVFDEDDTIVPAPQHTGHAEYTLKIAKQIAAKTGCKVCDCLTCTPRETLYDMKKKGLPIEDDMALKKIHIPGKRVWFLDNIIASGHTFKKAKELIPKLIPLPYAVSSRATIRQNDDGEFNVDYEE